MSKPKYDSTVARIAGNILSGRDRWTSIRDRDDTDAEAVSWAVGMARAIVAEVERTETARESQEAPHAPTEDR